MTIVGFIRSLDAQTRFATVCNFLEDFFWTIISPTYLSRDFLNLQERRSFDEKFVRIDTEKLCKLASAALGLQLRPLVDLTCGALARIIGGKTPDEVRDIFHLPDDLTEVRVPFILSYRKRSFDLVDYNSPLWSSKTRHHHKSRGIKRGLSFETLTHAIFICQNLLSLRKRNWNR